MGEEELKLAKENLGWPVEPKFYIPEDVLTFYREAVERGPAQHSSCLENWFVGVPGLKVVAPQTPEDAKGMLITAIRDNNAVVFIEHKLLYRTKGAVSEELYEIPFGKARIARSGKDATILTYSIMVQRALDAAAQLEKEGIDIEVIDLRSLRPLDEQAIHESVTKTGRLLIVHEAPMTGGFGGELAAVVASGPSFDRLDAPIVRLGGKECPIPFNRILERAAVPQTEDIVEAQADRTRPAPGAGPLWRIS